jgi:thiol-disulfide isomerase/thioredoxin
LLINKIAYQGAAPDFTFPGINGKMFSLSDYRDKVVLVNIWATWCSPCVDEMPSMEKLYQKLKGEKFEIMVVSIDSLGVRVVARWLRNPSISCFFISDDLSKKSHCNKHF